MRLMKTFNTTFRHYYIFDTIELGLIFIIYKLYSKLGGMIATVL